ncbi:hypothetical protein, conserved [Plasmodium gonderi]|uniref:Uncharacterized protein n=1 Tax=Plasmodium gonderi TaxID=77519 RepID=A0A1Y1JNV7_PLAGO|nr:hypothetical protein, conserved [Plasmodium gonderi]GAW81744.1 hypothetical protein, conserved [Plasmodium gonderi]
MISIKKYLVFCEKKKSTFILSVIGKCNNSHMTSNYISCTFDIKQRKFGEKKKQTNCFLVKNKESLSLNNKTPRVLCEFNVDADKKILFQNLLNFNLEDILTIFKLLLQLKKIILNKYNNNISLKIKEVNKKSNYYKRTIRAYIPFFKKYLARNKYDEDRLLNLFGNLEFVPQAKKIDNTTNYDKTRSSDISTEYFMRDRVEVRSTYERRKQKYTIAYILKKIIHKLNLEIKAKCYENNVRDKSFLFKFFVNKKNFHILSFYKKIKGDYYLFRNVMYVHLNRKLVKDVAVVNLISNNKSYFKIKKNCIQLNPFYVKYYYKYHLHKFLHLCEDLNQKGYKKLSKENIRHLSKIGVYSITHEQRVQCKYSRDENSPVPCYGTSQDEADNKNSLKKNASTHLQSDDINIKVVNIFLNGKFSFALPLVLTYNINKKNFYLNNLFYLDSIKYDLTSISHFRDIYFNNIVFFQRKNFIYLNNENIILNSDNLHFDLNYVLLFYFLNFNERENLCIRPHINPTFCFYPPISRKNSENSKIIKRIVYRPEKNVLNFVF